MLLFPRSERDPTPFVLAQLLRFRQIISDCCLPNIPSVLTILPHRSLVL